MNEVQQKRLQRQISKVIRDDVNEGWAYDRMYPEVSDKAAKAVIKHLKDEGILK